MKSYDLLIVGNGVLGYSLAFALISLDPKLKIAILGNENRDGSATTSAGAMLGCFGEVTKYTFKSPYGIGKFKLSLEAHRMWDDWLSELNAIANTQLERVAGTTILLNSISGKLDSENFVQILETLKKENEPYEELDPLKIEGLNPHDDFRPLKAIYLPKEAAIHPMLLLNTLKSALLKHENVTFLLEDMVDLTVGQNQVLSVRTANNTLFAENYIFAAGVNNQFFIDKIPALAKRIPRLLSGVGCSMLLKTSLPKNKINHIIRTPNRAGACGLNVIPRDNFLFLGASNNVSLNPKFEPKTSICHFLLQCFLEQIDKDGHDADIVKINIGNRPMTVDTFPLLGATSLGNLWLLTGTYRDGLQQSPYLAQLLANEIIKGEKQADIAHFKPERLPLNVCGKEETIEETVLNYMSGAYEHSMRLPRIGWDDLFQRMVTMRIKEIYSALDTDFYVPIELMLMLDFERDSADLINFFRKYYKEYEPPLS